MNTCTDRRPDGTQCACRRFSLRPDQVAGEPPTCWSCSHWETCHPEATPIATKPLPALPSNVPDIFSSSRALFKGKMPAGSSKAAVTSSSRASAHSEANFGFRSGGGSHDQVPAVAAARGRSKGKSRQMASKGGPADDLKAHGVGRIIILPCGFDKQNRTHLNETSSPNNAKLQDLLRCNLAVEASDAKPLRFDPNWDTVDIDTYLRGLFPPLFMYLDERRPPKTGSLHWTLLAKGGRQLSIASLTGHTQPVASDILRHRYPVSKTWQDRWVWIALKHELPIEVYEAWDPSSAAGVGNSSSDIEPQIIGESVYPSLTDADHLLFGPLTESEAETDIEEAISELKGKGKGRAEAHGIQNRYNLRERKRTRAVRSSSPIELLDTDTDDKEGKEAESERREYRLGNKRRRVTLGTATESMANLDLKSNDSANPSVSVVHRSNSSYRPQVAGSSTQSRQASSIPVTRTARRHQERSESDREGSPEADSEVASGSPHNLWSVLGADLLPPPAKNPWTR